MVVEALRVVTDPWEWAALVRPAPSLYHSRSWATAAAQRLRPPDLALAYIRVYVGDAAVGCPVIRVRGEWSNVPRAVPLVLRGELADPTAALLADRGQLPEHMRRMVLLDDSKQVNEIVDTGQLLERSGAVAGRYREMDRRIVSEMARRVDWADDADQAAWMAALRNAWTFGEWAVEVRSYVNPAGETIGWAVWASRDGSCHCIASAIVGGCPQSWATAR